MKHNILRIIAGVIILFLYFNCGGGKQVREDEISLGETEEMYGKGTKTIITEGMAEVRKAGVPEAYDRATEDALKKAIEKALGTIIDARIIGSSGVILEENIYAKKQGYIKKYKILSKRVDDGIAYVKVKAVVGMEKLKDDVMALDILHHRMNLPKTIILVNEDNLGKSGTTAYDTLVKKFTEKRFTIISPEEISASYKKKIKRLFSNLEGDENKFVSLAAKIGLDVNADIVIIGKAKSVSAGKVKYGGYTGDMKSYQADVSFKVVNVGDGRIIAVSSKHRAAVHISDQTGGINAIKKASGAAADDLINQILKAWEDILNNGNLITLYVKGLTLTDEIKFSKSLKEHFREVKEVYAKQKKGRTSVFTVRFLGTPRDLATALVTKETFDYNVDIKSYDFGKLTISAKKK